MAGSGGPLIIWNEWATQILVLLSLTLQVILLLFAGIRRRESSAVPTFLLWLAYLLADSTAIYALGHISLSGSPSKHQLVAFWAPFLLLHLGGPDNITAYSLEDSKLWLRHLQNLVVQVLGAAYVLYKYVAGGDLYIMLAAVLMFAVGVVKYGERTWALKRSNLDSIRGSLEPRVVLYHHFHPPDYKSTVLKAAEDDEFYLRRAHSMFHVCKRAFVDSWVVNLGKDSDQSMEKDSDKQLSFREEGYGMEKDDSDKQLSSKEEDQSLDNLVQVDIERELNSDDKGLGMWTLMEMELSLMYDLLYTKAGMIHTWLGYGVRVASSLTAAASLLLFYLSSSNKDDGHGIVDLAVSYTLLSGALLLETASLLRALGSTWTYAFLCDTRWSWLRYAALCTGRWDRLRRLVKAITGSRSARRRWSGKVGQFNMLHACRRRNRAYYESLVGRMAMMLGYQDWWFRYHFSGSTELSEGLKHRLFEYTRRLIRKGGVNMQGVIRRDWGLWAFESRKKDDKEKEMDDVMELHKNLTTRFNCLGAEFQEGVIIWHIATDLFIAKISGGDDEQEVRDIRTLSNYMAFLLADRPYMLPGLAQSMLYRQTCDNLAAYSPALPERNVRTKLKEVFRLRDGPNLRHADDLTQHDLYDNEPKISLKAPRLFFSYRVAQKLEDWMDKISNKSSPEKGREYMLQLLLDVWMDFLLYAANRCSRESHAKKLSNGGELTTILWLMTDYLHHDDNYKEEQKSLEKKLRRRR